MAIVRTVDKRKVEVEVGAGKDEMVWLNANHVVSVEESG